MPSTPKPEARVSSSQSSTPLTRTSAKPPDSDPRLQSELKREMKEELGDAVYQSLDPFEKAYFALHQPDIHTIIAKLLNGKKLNVYLEALGFPKKGAEPLYYLPFSRLLNHIKNIMKNNGLMKDSIYTNLEFEVYDREMSDGTDNDAPLKPDLIARQKVTTLPSSASWREVELCAEVKSNWPELIAQANTYARCLFAFQRNRRFVPMIFFKQDTMEVKFGMYTAAWLCHSEQGLKLRTENGFKDFVEQIGRLFSCSSRWTGGFDLSTNNGECYIPGYGVYEFKENLCYRISARGRRTRVDVIQKQSASLAPTQQRNDRYPLRTLPRKVNRSGTNIRAKGSGFQNSKGKILSCAVEEEDITRLVADLKINKHELAIRTDRNDPVLPADLDIHTEKDGNGKFETFILKDSWPLSERATEGSMFQPLAGRFGLPHVLHSYTVSSLNGEEDRTEDLFPSKASPSLLWGGKVNEVQEKRVHMRIILTTQGKPLKRAIGPKEMTLGVLHAIIGHWVLFMEGWLHRDVSIGNVLLMLQPVTCGPVLGLDLPGIHLTQCRGFITDGDLAVEWERVDRDIAMHRSGTPPFMSIALLNAIETSRGYEHTAVDDLESFVWVLLWAALETLDEISTLSTIERGFFNTLHRSDLQSLTRRAVFATELLENQLLPSPGFSVFNDLLSNWLDMAARFHREVVMKKHDTSKKKDYQRIYEDYLKVGFDAVQKMPEDWDYARTSKPTSPVYN